MKLFIFAFLICGVLSTSLPAAKTYARNWGWSEGKVVIFYTFTNGNFTSNGVVTSAPIYVFRSTNDTTATALQNNLINVVPGDSGYSDLWQVNVVVVSDKSIIPVTSLTALNSAVSAGKATINAWTTTKNCPVVGQGSMLDPADVSAYPLIQGYYMGSPVFYYDFGVNPNTIQPVYHLVVNGTTPTVVGAIFGTVPADSGYTAFWDLKNVPVSSSYQNGTYSTTGQVAAAAVDQYTLVNCPIVNVATSVTGNTTAQYVPVSANLLTLSLVFLLLSIAVLLV